MPVYGTHAPKEDDWGDRADCGRLQDCLSAGPGTFLGADQGRNRGQQGYCAAGLVGLPKLSSGLFGLGFHSGISYPLSNVSAIAPQ